MGGLLNKGKVLDEDAFHPVYQIPEHFPKIDNNCSSNVSSCVLKTHTVSQCVYEEGDKLFHICLGDTLQDVFTTSHNGSYWYEKC